MEISTDTPVNELRAAPEFCEAKEIFIASATDFFAQSLPDMTLKGLQEQHPTWDAEDMVFGMKRLQEIALSGKYVYKIYPEQEIAKNPALGQVILTHHPAKGSKKDPFVLLLSGGAYGAVCNLPEAFPVAARLNELGVTSFSLSYRTADASSMVSGLMPKPIEDVAHALMFLHKYFGLDPSQAIIGGFSAGGHLALMWGAKCGEYGMPKPAMLMLDYPLVSLEHLPEGAIREFMCTGLFGAGWDEMKMQSYSAHRLVGDDFPKTYAVLAEDDDTVSAQDSRDLEAALEKKHIPYLIERVKTGGHGFGLGTKTDAAGWVDRAMEFYDKKS